MTEAVSALIDHAESLFGDQPVVFAYVFGSQAGGESRPDSDLDVGVLATGDADSLSLRLELIDRLGRTVRSRADVVVLNQQPIRFLGRVLRGRIVVYSRDEPARVAWESLHRRMADDVEIWAAPLDRVLLTATSEGRR
jgi:hypothetical protein